MLLPTSSPVPLSIPVTNENVLSPLQAYVGLLELSSARDKYSELCVPMVMVPATVSNNVPGSDLSIGSDTALNAITDVSAAALRSVCVCVVSHTHTESGGGSPLMSLFLNNQKVLQKKKSSQGTGEGLGVLWFQCKHRFHQQHLEQSRADPGSRTQPAGRTAAFTPTHTHSQPSWCQQTDPQVHK